MYYEAILESELPRSTALDFSELGLLRLDLGRPITEEEVWEAIR
jgi:hypothetical protein